MKLGTLTRAGYLRLLKKLGGTGLTQEEDTVRHTELDAVARMAEMVTEAIDGAMRNLFLVSALECLDTFERVRFLLQQSTLTPERRRARLIAFGQSAKLARDRLGYAIATYLEASTGSTIGVEAYDLLEQGASPLGAFMLALREPDATEKQQRRDLAPILQRGLPARGIAGGLSTVDAVWGAAFEPAGISPEPDNFLSPQSKSRSAVIEALPGDRLTADQWVEIQAMLCWKSHGFTINQNLQGRTVLYGEVALGAAGTALIDGPTANSSINWENRFIQAWGIIATSGGTDPTVATNVERVWLPASKTGPSAGGYTHTLFDTQQPAVTTGVTLKVDASGNLEITNTTGGTLHITLMIRCTPQYIPTSGIDRQPWIDQTEMEHDDVEELYQAQVITDGTVGHFGGGFAGAMRRVVYSGPLYKTDGVGRPQGVILDTSEDWRNRWVLVCDINHATSTAANFPTPSTFGMLARPSTTNPGAAKYAPRLFYTGIGSAMGSATQLGNQQPMNQVLSGSLPDIWLFARSSDGALVCEMKDGLSAHDAATMLAMVIATETTDGFATVTPVPVHATKIHTIDIEQPQNCGVFAQGRQGNAPRYLISDIESRAIPTSPPMGVISEGAFPSRPVSWMVRERLGARDDARYEVRQKLTGQRKRLFSAVIPAGTAVPVDDFNIPSEMFPAGVNDQMDFRDRLVWVEGRYSGSDITVSDATPSTDASGTPFLAILYTGPATRALGSAGADSYRVTITTNLFIDFHFSRAASGAGFHSELLITNATGSPVYLNCAIECSGFLGFADRRAVGQDV